MGLVVVWPKKTRREKQIEQVADDIRFVELLKQKMNSDAIVGDEAERYFKAWAQARHDVDVERFGWPDFLLHHKTSGKVFAVEVKSHSDALSEQQLATFALLEKAGLPVYVWEPDNPKQLVQWRTFHAKYRGGRVRRDSPASGRQVSKGAR